MHISSKYYHWANECGFDALEIKLYENGKIGSHRSNIGQLSSQPIVTDFECILSAFLFLFRRKMSAAA